MRTDDVTRGDGPPTPERMADLPVLIAGPGDYATRDGGRVTIREIHPAPGGSVTAFTAKGSVWTVRNKVLRPRGNDVWHVSGRYKAVGLCGRDIVGPYVRE